MKNLSRGCWIGVVLVGVFALGVLFDRYVAALLSRDVNVWLIPGVEGRGCEGATQDTLFRFGSPVDWTHGVYKIPCHEFGVATETSALRCSCR